ncbi:hypothetical protein GGS20DRAFT_214164 [Poronia punctata]|nr:hypothetical protein GGS20DRAFT_214164 [Poronia punctata]
MHASLPILALTSLTTAFPLTSPRPCFVIGPSETETETAETVTALARIVTCSHEIKTIAGVPDVQSGSLSFSSIDFSSSSSSDKSPLRYALSTFATTADPLASSDLSYFQDALNAYLATEAGVRSVENGSLDIEVPRLFLQMQVSRIRTAQGDRPFEPELQVDRLRDEILESAAGEDQVLLDQVMGLAKEQ